MDKSERLEGQQSLHTAGGSTGYNCSGAVGSYFVDFVRHV
jgi:hypothetical protein